MTFTMDTDMKILSNPQFLSLSEKEKLIIFS